MREAELEQIAAQYADTIYRTALQYTRIPADAEDILQEVLLERYQTQTTFTSAEHEKYWLLRVTVNKCKNLLRSRSRRKTVALEEAAILPTPPPRYQALYDAVLGLPRKYRLTVDLFYYEGYSSKEIAGILHVREATVRTWLRRARLQLQKILKEDWDYDEY